MPSSWVGTISAAFINLPTDLVQAKKVDERTQKTKGEAEEAKNILSIDNT